MIGASHALHPSDGVSCVHGGIQACVDAVHRLIPEAVSRAALFSLTFMFISGSISAVSVKATSQPQRVRAYEAQRLSATDASASTDSLQHRQTSYMHGDLSNKPDSSSQLQHSSVM